MGKIATTLGRMIKQDQATMNRDKLEFARVLIEMDISKGFPNSIKFEDEKRSLVYLEVSYEWKPEKCATCDGIGHTSNVCKKAKVVEQMKKIWKPKEVTETVKNPPEKETEDDQRFKKVKGFIWLLETKVKASKMGALYLQMFKGWCFSSNLAHHPNGRIIIAWNPNSFEVDIKGGTNQLIHCVLKPKRGHSFALTVVYAADDSKTREILWRDLVTISEGMKIPWIVGGDFNAVLNPEERLEYRGNANELIPFQTYVNKCGLEDVKYNGRFFTWNNKQDGKNRVYAKLNRILATSDWIDTYSTAEVSFLPEGDFDHSPALLTIYPSMQNIKKPFRYFNFWKNLNGFLDVMKQFWQEKVAGSHMYQLVFLLKQLKFGLKSLNRQGRGDVELQEKEAYQHLLNIQQQL
ncbi:uncharacterized protein LOC133806542 [Humulus lupulus]|uniref:uncharacterized protein LOC133806542 n=1 Tax=Humulus lupulus TaxID=3486 RepID=UPI002B405821|nr:uncharacterized protein LOC133806542 [Humulus lupulus]